MCPDVHVRVPVPVGAAITEKQRLKLSRLDNGEREPHVTWYNRMCCLVFAGSSEIRVPAFPVVT